MMGQFALARGHVFLVTGLGSGRRWLGFAHRVYITPVVIDPLNDIAIVAQSQLVLMAMEQCEAAEAIRLRYGAESAFDYVVGEKLLNFAEAAATNAEFAQALPQFVSRVRDMFTVGTAG